MYGSILATEANKSLEEAGSDSQQELLQSQELRISAMSAQPNRVEREGSACLEVYFEPSTCFGGFSWYRTVKRDVFKMCNDKRRVSPCVAKSLLCGFLVCVEGLDRGLMHDVRDKLILNLPLHQLAPD